MRSTRTGDALKLLQLSRELIDGGKNPKMLLGSLLACYRDLLLVKSVPDCSLMLVSGISHSALLEIADAWDYNAIANGLEQLRTSEWQLSKSAHPTLWLELCLLGLASIPQLKSYATDSAIANPRQSERTSKLRSPRSSDQTIWEKVLSATSEKNRALLSAASLIALTEKKDDLHAIHKKLSAFKKNLDPAWMSFNYHRFDASALEEAIDCALTPALGTEKAKLVAIEGCNFKQFTEEAMDVLPLLSQIPEKTHLVFQLRSATIRLAPDQNYTSWQLTAGVQTLL